MTNDRGSKKASKQKPEPLTPQGFTTKDPEGQQGTTHPGGRPDENGNGGSTGTAHGCRKDTSHV